MRAPLAAIVETRKLAEQGDWKLSKLLEEVWRRAGGIEAALAPGAGAALLAKLAAAEAVVAAAREEAHGGRGTDHDCGLCKAVDAYDAARGAR